MLVKPTNVKMELLHNQTEMSAHVFAQLVILVLSVRHTTHAPLTNVKTELPHNQMEMSAHVFAQLVILVHSVRHTTHAQLTNV